MAVLTSAGLCQFSESFQFGLLFFQLLASLVSNLVPPQPVLVVAGEAVDDDWDGQGQDKHADESAQPSNDFSNKCLRILVIVSDRR